MTRLGATLLALFLTAGAAIADPIRIATFNMELGRDGPGLLLRDIRRGSSADISDAVNRILEIDPDIIALQGFDWDHEGRALNAFDGLLKQAGGGYDHRLSLRPNTGLQTGLDMDGDGRRGGPSDAQGFGFFTGQNGIAILSRFPIDRTNLQDYSDLLWRDLPGAQLPKASDGTPFPSPIVQARQRLSSTGHWVVPILVPNAAPLRDIAESW